MKGETKDMVWKKTNSFTFLFNIWRKNCWGLLVCLLSPIIKKHNAFQTNCKGKKESFLFEKNKKPSKMKKSKKSFSLKKIVTKNTLSWKNQDFIHEMFHQTLEIEIILESLEKFIWQLWKGKIIFIISWNISILFFLNENTYIWLCENFFERWWRLQNIQEWTFIQTLLSSKNRKNP